MAGGVGVVVVVVGVGSGVDDCGNDAEDDDDGNQGPYCPSKPPNPNPNNGDCGITILPSSPIVIPYGIWGRTLSRVPIWLILISKSIIAKKGRFSSIGVVIERG